MTLRATTCLGENTEPILRQIVRNLRSTGLDIDFDESLDWSEREECFRRGDIDLAWACGLLTAQQLRSGLDMDVIAAPVFTGEAAAIYRSVLVARREHSDVSIDDTFQMRLAINEYGSWSGYAGFAAWLEQRGRTIDAYRTIVVTGSHRNSASAMIEGVADLASIDETVWAHLLATEPDTFAQLAVVGRTADWPAPPFSVRDQAIEVSRLVDAARGVDGLERVVPAEIEDYAAMVGD